MPIYTGSSIPLLLTLLLLCKRASARAELVHANMPNQAIASLVSAIILGPSWSGPRPRSVKVTKDGIELPRNRERARSQVPYRENLTDAELGRRMRQMTEDGNREGRSRERRNEMNDPRGRGNVLMIGNGRPVIVGVWSEFRDEADDE